MITNAEMKPSRYARWASARRKLAWITSQVNAGATVYLSSHTRATKITRKHLPLLKATKSGLLVKCGKKWIDYTYTQITARQP